MLALQCTFCGGNLEMVYKRAECFLLLLLVRLVQSSLLFSEDTPSSNSIDSFASKRITPYT